jgi:hypothetical protein
MAANALNKYTVLLHIPKNTELYKQLPLASDLKKTTRYSLTSSNTVVRCKDVKSNINKPETSEWPPAIKDFT